MGLTQEVQEQVKSYVEGQIQLSDLRQWLDVRVQAILDASDDEAEALADRAWALFAEFDYGHRDEADVRAELAKQLTVPHSESLHTRGLSDRTRASSSL